MNKTRALPVEDLRIGMYVSALDRPWLETPFLFQGFVIDDTETLDELKAHCEFVHVDVERSAHSAFELPPGRIPERSANGRRPAPAPARHAGVEPPVNDETEALKLELDSASKAHATATRVVGQMLDRVRSGESVAAATIEESLNPMIDSIVRNEDAMTWLTRMKRKNDYVYDHSLASSVWAIILGRQLGLDRAELLTLGMGATFMDVGKTRIPTKLLTKTGELTSQEQAELRRHVEYGVEIALNIKGVDPRVVQMVQHHHERLNGTGYPTGLMGEQIPLFARIAGIVDTYDAMTTRRPYAELLSTYDAMRELNKLAGVEFHEELIEQFVQAIGIFPVGSLVELNTGEVGVVIAQNRVRRLRPRIMIILDRDKQPVEDSQIIDLLNQLADASGETSLWIERGLAADQYGIDPSDYYL